MQIIFFPLRFSPAWPTRIMRHVISRTDLKNCSKRFDRSAVNTQLMRSLLDSLLLTFICHCCEIYETSCSKASFAACFILKYQIGSCTRVEFRKSRCRLKIVYNWLGKSSMKDTEQLVKGKWVSILVE